MIHFVYTNNVSILDTQVSRLYILIVSKCLSVKENCVETFHYLVKTPF